MSLSAWSPSCYSQQQRHCRLFLMPVLVRRRRGHSLARWKRLPTTGTASSITNCPRQGSPGRKICWRLYAYGRTSPGCAVSGAPRCPSASASLWPARPCCGRGSESSAWHFRRSAPAGSPLSAAFSGCRRASRRLRPSVSDCAIVIRW